LASRQSGPVVLGLAIVCGIFFAEAIVDSRLSSSVSRARGVEERSMASVEKLVAVAGDGSA
jgi:hypothetical protein